LDTKDLLTIAGICAQNQGADNYSVLNYGFATPAYVCEIMELSNLEYELEGYTLIIKSKIDEELWRNAIRNTTTGGVENDSFRSITAYDVDLYCISFGNISVDCIQAISS
jgi:hypothetical protein